MLVLLSCIVTWEHGHIVGITLHHTCNYHELITNYHQLGCQGTGQWHRRYTKLQLLYQSSPDSSKPLQLAMGSSIILESHEYGTFCFVRQLLMRNALPDQRILP